MRSGSQGNIGKERCTTQKGNNARRLNVQALLSHDTVLWRLRSTQLMRSRMPARLMVSWRTAEPSCSKHQTSMISSHIACKHQCALEGSTK